MAVNLKAKKKPEEIIKIWREDPVRYVRDVFGVELDEWQKDGMESYRDNPRTGFVACKGPGKSALLALIAWHFLDTHPFPKIAVTSISEQNLSDGLWTEMAKWQQKSKRLQGQYRWTKTRITHRQYPETWWMSARTWAKGADSSAQADTLAGLHADFILFLLDEAGGIPSGVMAAADAALANDLGDGTKKARIVIAGNPTHTEGPLYEASKDPKRWKIFNISSAPDDPKRTPRVSKEWAQSQIDKYGADNPWVLVNVFGKFPPASMNQLIGIEEVQAAVGRYVAEEDYSFAQKRIGCDVARQGDDASMLAPRQGKVVHKLVEMRNWKTHEVGARLLKGKMAWESEMEFVDGTGGYGGGVVDWMLVAGYPVMEVHFSGKASDSRFANCRAEMYFRMAEWIRNGGSLPDDPELVREIAAHTYTFDNKGRFLLEPKDKVKEKLAGHSPDRADAVAMTFYLPEMKTQNGEMGILSRLADAIESGGKGKREYDPFHDL